MILSHLTQSQAFEIATMALSNNNIDSNNFTFKYTVYDDKLRKQISDEPIYGEPLDLIPKAMVFIECKKDEEVSYVVQISDELAIIVSRFIKETNGITTRIINEEASNIYWIYKKLILWGFEPANKQHIPYSPIQ